ncbi:hypothetical protein PX52LOC_08250 [Limnoglobus roseus]|uniref:Uncharacterized protein n=2 Tax=Limnoglobus roseus TaxID=2598579 RepID=A0A5C1AQ42_9BACT|nr:hypothetical protein PX52LOC_08250 [Limnoglobus roseus]
MLLAFFNTVRVAKLIEGALATAGGFLVGYVLAMILGWMIDKYVFKRPSPAFLHRIGRMLGGLILAILVAMMVFNGGGGEGDGTGDGTGNGKSSPVNGTLDPTTPNTQPQPTPRKHLPPAEERVRVTVLGGTDVKGERFYLVEDDLTPRTLEEVKALVQQKKDATSKTLHLEVQYRAQNTLFNDHPSVSRLRIWANRTAGLAVDLPPETP